MKRGHEESFKKYKERIKETALSLKRYLKGKVLPGTESYGGRKKGKLRSYRGKEVLAETHRKRKAHKKRIKKIAYSSKAFRRNKKSINIKFCK